MTSEKAELQRSAGVIHFTSGDTRISSATLLRSEFSEGRIAITHARDYLDGRNLDRGMLSETVERMRAIPSLVIGNLILDEHVDCKPLGVSAEDPTVVVAPFPSTKFIGGAGIVAVHAASLGKRHYSFRAAGTMSPNNGLGKA